MNRWSEKIQEPEWTNRLQMVLVVILKAFPFHYMQKQYTIWPSSKFVQY